MKRNRLFLALAAILAIGIGVAWAQTLTTSIGVNISGNLAGTAGLTTPGAQLAAQRTISLANGTGASQANKVYATTLAITTGATTDVDLAGSLTDALGAAFTPSKVKAVYIYSAPTNTTNLTLFGDTNSVPILNTAATTVTLLPGGMFLLVEPPNAGIAVTGATGDIIQIANAAGATASVDLVVVAVQ